MVQARLDPRDPSQTTPALRRLLGRAVMITRESSEGKQGLQASFTTLLTAFLVADDPLSRWFQAYATQVGVDRDAIFTYKSIPRDYLRRVREAEAPEKELMAWSDVTVSAGNILQTADDLRNASDVGAPLDVRHVMAAYIYQPGTSHERQLAEWGLDREAWSVAFLQQLSRHHPVQQQELEAWQEVHTQVFGTPPELERLLSLRLAGYSADRATGRAEDDLLNVSPDVNALAGLIAAKSTSPPLAVGIFGDWGSGKTFFMRSLMRRIDALTTAARSEDRPEAERLQKEITFYKRIVQIEFNAWHYVEGNLWASLVEHIFTNLRISQDPEWDPDGTQIETLQRELLDRLEIQQQLVDRAQEQARQAVQRRDAVKRHLDDVERDREEKLQELEDISMEEVITDQDLSPLMGSINEALTKAGFREASQALDEVRAALTEARSTLQYAGSVLAPLLQAEDRDRRAGLLLAALLIGPLIGLLAWMITQPTVQESIARFAGIASGVATFGLSLAAWMRRQVQWTTQRLAQIEQADARLRTLQTRKVVEHDARIAKLQQEADKLNADYIAAQQQMQVAQQRIEELQAQLQQATPLNSLARFIQDRTDSDDYRKHLGLLALIRRDFKTLSDYVDAENRRIRHEIKGLAEEKRGEERRINRIVLYIDDLDRCPPDKVVEVLQAVHLLLAFPLFVVVVGVDARWVSHSLQQHYPNLLHGEEALQRHAEGAPMANDLGFGHDATPHDYLEKIFQIPIWLKPVDPDGSKRMLDGLLAEALVADRAQVEAGDDGGAGAEGPAREPAGEPGGVPAPQTTDRPRTAAGDGAATTGDLQQIDLTPESLDIRRKELEAMKALAPVLGRSPRAVKRFTNTYRLLKAALEQADEPLSLEDGDPVGDYEAVMFLLAVVTGLPAISRRFFTIVAGDDQRSAAPGEQQDTAQQERTLSWALSRLEAGLSADGLADCDRLRRWLHTHAAGVWQNAPVAPFAKRAPQVARYSFRVERLQTQTDPGRQQRDSIPHDAP